MISILWQNQDLMFLKKRGGRKIKINLKDRNIILHDEKHSLIFFNMKGMKNWYTLDIFSDRKEKEMILKFIFIDFLFSFKKLFFKF